MTNEQQVILAELRTIRESLEALTRSRATPRAYSVSEAARLLSVSPRTVQRMILGGQLQSVAVGSRRLIPSAEIEVLTTPLPELPTKQRKPKASHSEEMGKLRALTASFKKR